MAEWANGASCLVACWWFPLMAWSTGDRVAFHSYLRDLRSHFDTAWQWLCAAGGR